jgi:ADP-ribose pyrophosphatase
MNVWARAKDDEVITLGWRQLVKKTFVQPDGKEAEYVTKDLPGKPACAVIALTPENMVVIAEQFRLGPEVIMDELPGGGSEKDESLEDAVKRELLEETGYTVGSITYLGLVYKDAYTNTQWHFFLARDCIDTGSQHLDDGEFVTPKLITIDKLFENARTGKMTDVSAVFLAYDELVKIKSEGL